jgi:hypothetical protein
LQIVIPEKLEIRSTSHAHRVARQADRRLPWLTE